MEEEKEKRIGVLDLQGDVEEHFLALEKAAKKLNKKVEIIKVKKKEDFEQLSGLIIPGGESTAISKLLGEEGIESAKKVKKIMGTCAGAIMLAKKVIGATEKQRFLSLMDIEISRNAYGSQIDSFEAKLETIFGKIDGIFIRAPKIVSFEKEVKPIAFYQNQVVGLYQKRKNCEYIALTFHPELTTTKFHEFFLR